ncbi:MAG: hypothetical protein A4S09_13035 [Proteobacteria bacterium SG_bin7]|nr:MAG: hypothetical protein A4S09_13035 [Proteobacteria bacterium SG_bin7]
MVVTITSLKLRHLWGYFPLTYLALWVTLQVYKQKGFIKFKNTGFGYDHYTLTAWESEADMKSFSRTGAHVDAMKHAKKLAQEVRILTYKSNALPSWKEVKKLLAEKADRVVTF